MSILNERMQAVALSVVIIIPLALLTYYLYTQKDVFPVTPQGLGKPTLHIGRTPVQFTAAQTQEERTRGLSGRKRLGENEGLLFIFPKNGRQGIWMKDMLFPIDIIWISEDLTVVGIKENATPDSYPEVFYPEREARYVLEVNALFVEIKGIRIGDQVNIPKQYIAGDGA